MENINRRSNTKVIGDSSGFNDRLIEPKHIVLKDLKQRGRRTARLFIAINVVIPLISQGRHHRIRETSLIDASLSDEIFNYSDALSLSSISLQQVCVFWSHCPHCPPELGFSSFIEYVLGGSFNKSSISLYCHSIAEYLLSSRSESLLRNFINSLIIWDSFRLLLTRYPSHKTPFTLNDVQRKINPILKSSELTLFNIEENSSEDSDLDSDTRIKEDLSSLMPSKSIDSKYTNDEIITDEEQPEYLPFNIKEILKPLDDLKLDKFHISLLDKAGVMDSKDSYLSYEDEEIIDPIYLQTREESEKTKNVDSKSQTWTYNTLKKKGTSLVSFKKPKFLDKLTTHAKKMIPTYGNSKKDNVDVADKKVSFQDSSNNYNLYNSNNRRPVMYNHYPNIYSQNPQQLSQQLNLDRSSSSSDSKGRSPSLFDNLSISSNESSGTLADEDRSNDIYSGLAFINSTKVQEGHSRESSVRLVESQDQYTLRKSFDIDNVMFNDHFKNYSSDNINDNAEKFRQLVLSRRYKIE